MEKHAERLRKLLELFKQQHTNPAYIGKEPAVLKCTITGPYYRISGGTGKNFPPETLEAVGATEKEMFAAFDWVAEGSHEHYSVSGDTFFVFIPEDESNWPKE